MRRIAFAFVTLGMFGALPACAHYDRARASYHEQRANRAAAKGNYGTADEQQRKANQARRAAETDKF